VPPARRPGERAVPLLEARGLVKKYGNVQALDGASFSAYPGEVVAANLHLGREIYRWWPPLHVLNKTDMRRRAVAAFADLGAGSERAVRQAGHREHRHPPTPRRTGSAPPPRSSPGPGSV
jgi:simple sugar transport system ATP-binding protein